MFIGPYCCLLVRVQPLSFAWVDLHHTDNLWALFQRPVVEFRLGYPIFYLGTSEIFPPTFWRLQWGKHSGFVPHLAPRVTCDQIISNIFFERKILGSHVRVFFFFFWKMAGWDRKYLWANEKYSWRHKIIYGWYFGVFWWINRSD